MRPAAARRQRPSPLRGLLPFAAAAAAAAGGLAAAFAATRVAAPTSAPQRPRSQQQQQQQQSTGAEAPRAEQQRAQLQQPQPPPSPPFSAGERTPAAAGTQSPPLPEEPPPGGCPQYYLYYGNMPRSRHSNHLASFVAALALARMLNRTLVVPPFTQDNREWALADLYDTAPLQAAGFCMERESEWTAREKRAKGASDGIAAGCIAMRGIATLPRSAQRSLRCRQTAMVERKKELAVNLRAIRSLSRARVLTVPLTVYLSELLDAGCVWGLLRPAAHLRQAVASFARSLPSKYSAVHLRGLERSCADRAKKFSPDPVTRREVERQCAMDASYVLPLLRGSGGGEKFFLADDGQRPQVSAELRAAGGVSYSGPLRGLEAALVDFWLLAGAELFIGNQMSTLSVNVCRVRTGQGRPCNNFVRWLGRPEDEDVGVAAAMLPPLQCVKGS
eukprot:TRINITY_DN19478_c0_g1_i1.p2 TRINITY_DN19478_c0_g1~~TRINITY_DN19478_c0_g1_i1.p2  ORF type:complete len:446 (+),score=161.17 TRINITY_DN19478_c0_g1_i1:99-1436(+)